MANPEGQFEIEEKRQQDETIRSPCQALVASRDNLAFI